MKGCFNKDLWEVRQPGLEVGGFEEEQRRPVAGMWRMHGSVSSNIRKIAGLGDALRPL